MGEGEINGRSSSTNSMNLSFGIRKLFCQSSETHRPSSMFFHHKSVCPGFTQNRFRRRNVGRLVIACLRATALIIIASNALFLFFKATLRRITSLMQLFKCTSAEKAERNSAAYHGVYVRHLEISDFPRISILEPNFHVNTD